MQSAEDVAEEGWLSREAAEADVLQLASLLTETHPDPYAGGGGAVAFRRRVADILDALPSAGLSRAHLLRLLRPLVASLRDGHTVIARPASAAPARPGGRLWLDWDLVEEQLYVGTVHRAQDRALLGARLAAIGGIPLAALLTRTGRLRGFDNAYTNLVHLAEALADPVRLGELLHPEKPAERVQVDLVCADGSPCTREFPLASEPPGTPIRPASALAAPEVDAAGLGWAFLDAEATVAWLRIDTLLDYRERFERCRATGSLPYAAQRLAEVAARSLQAPPPAALDTQIAAVPSATELLCRLFAAMRERRTRALIVDVRLNRGGDSFLETMLTYLLYGMEGLLSADYGYQVRRYSPLYLAHYTTHGDEEWRRIGESLRNGGYDFREEREWHRYRREGLRDVDRQRRLREDQEYVAQAPSFARVFAQGRWAAAWTPRVIVLTSAWTYSAGFDVAAALYKQGALLVGVPSSQAGNCFIDSLPYRLAHSDLRGSIAFKWSRLFPDDPERGEILRPQIELTYDTLRQMDFDPHAAVRLALTQMNAEGAAPG